MKRVTKKEFNYYFENYKPILEKIVNMSVLSEIKGEDECRKMEYDALSNLINTYWHLVQDFRPSKYYSMWMRKGLSCIDNVFEKLENKYSGKELKKVRSLHSKWLVNYAEPGLEEFRKGTSEYKFYKKMKEKGESIKKNIEEVLK